MADFSSALTPFSIFGTLFGGLYIALLIWLIPIVLLGVALYGRYRYFKAVGFEGWEGATPFYAWYAFGRALGGDREKLGLATACVGVASLLLPPLWIVFLIMQFILLKNPSGKEGGFSTGMAIGCVLLPFVFWHVAAKGVSEGKGEE